MNKNNMKQDIIDKLEAAKRNNSKLKNLSISSKNNDLKLLGEYLDSLKKNMINNCLLT